MSNRKPIPKGTRFEVFKRDKFTCQYCGSKAPDVVLHVDHIDPVANGGGNEIMNLVTSCVACNVGKSDKKLSNQSALSKQRAEIEALEERRQQLEMMMEWRRAATDYEVDELAILAKEIESITHRSLSKFGMQQLSSFRKKYEVSEILMAIDDLFPGPVESSAKFNEAFKRIPIKCKWRRMYGDHGARYAYIQAILRNRFQNQYARLVPVIYHAHIEQGHPLEEIEARARTTGSISDFCDAFGFDWR